MKQKIPSIFFCILILLLSAALFFVLSRRLIAQIDYHRSEICFQKGDYKKAAAFLERAAQVCPNELNFYMELGNVFSKMGESSSTIRDAYKFARQARKHYAEAIRLNPLEPEAFYGMARVEMRLEQLYPYLYPGKPNPFRPFFYLNEAVRLRPNGITYHYALAKYLKKCEDRSVKFEKRSEDISNLTFLSVIEKLAYMYPPCYYNLKRENFWSPVVMEIFKKGLEKALEQNITPRDTHMILSLILAEEENLTDAISHYRQGMECKPFLNGSSEYIHLGNLYLKNGQNDKGEVFFIEGLYRSASVETDLEKLYVFYKNTGTIEEFKLFLNDISQRFALSSRAEILEARVLFDLEQYERARELLAEIIRSNPSAEAYYWLAKIAEKEQDWDKMELAIQKATVLDPKNQHYRQVFANAVNRRRAAYSQR